MNAKLRRTCSVIVVLILVLAGALVQPFGGNATAGPNGEGTLPGPWRGGPPSLHCPSPSPPPSPSPSSSRFLARAPPRFPATPAPAIPPRPSSPPRSGASPPHDSST